MSQHPGGSPVARSLSSEPVLVVSQKAKVIEVTNEYDITDRQGTPLGSVREVGQSPVKKAVRLVSQVDQYLGQRAAGGPDHRRRHPVLERRRRYRHLLHHRRQRHRWWPCSPGPPAAR